MTKKQKKTEEFYKLNKNQNWYLRLYKKKDFN